MITEFVASAILVYGYNYLTSTNHKIRKGFKDINNLNNLDFKISKIIPHEYGYKIIVPLYGQDYDKLYKLKSILQSTFKHEVFIEQSKNYSKGIINIPSKDLNDDCKYISYKVEAPYELYIGLNYEFLRLKVNMNKFPHLLVSGQTGSGKTEEIRLILTNLINNFTERDVNLYFSDLSDMCDYEVFKKCKQTKAYCKDIKTSEKLFKYLLHTYKKRLSIFSKNGCKNIKEYNKKFNEKRMAYGYLILDEFADYFPTNKFEENYEEKIYCYNLLKHMVRKFRKAGIFLIIGIQRPDATVLDPSLRSNICTKIGFSQNTDSSSLVVCDNTELTNIAERKALFMYGNTREWFRSLYIDDKTIRKYIKDSKVVFNSNLNKFLENPKKSSENNKDNKSNNRAKIK